MTKKEKIVFEALLEACKQVLLQARQTENCGGCGQDNDDHADDCPVPKAEAAMQLYEELT